LAPRELLDRLAVAAEARREGLGLLEPEMDVRQVLGTARR